MVSLQSAVAAEALPERVPEAQHAIAEIRNISLAAMAELRSTVRRLRSLDPVPQLPAGLSELPRLADQARGNGLDVRIDHVENPRVEAEEHYYNAVHTKLMDLGLKPHLLSETLIESMFETIGRYKDRVIPDHILPATRWRGVRERSPG